MGVALMGMGTWGVIPIETVVSQSANRPLSRSGTSSSANPSLEQSHLEAVWSRSLQGKLLSAKPPARPVAPTPPRIIVKPNVVPAVPIRTDTGIRLVGTVVEPGRSLAIATDRQGQFAFQGVGERLRLLPKGVLVESIDSAGVWVKYKGQRIQLVVGENLMLNSESKVMDRSQDRASQDTPMQDTPMQDTPMQDTPMQNGPMQNGPMQNGPMQNGLERHEHLDDDIPNDRTPIRPEEFPQFNLEDELEFLNG
ncbi:hypothetical protein CA13_40350 [Planctomycetes bacterium CA13]|uniref:Type II secretion system protein GspC N-terminal domain-containing protein n=2 Tax=Novipirellula herctigrandis TaxID=2527986 RepID=A0A5C5Z5I1_9BACT|nr:hypothetical protein CA13_40350 [Planctomycetes bacterium CA13]